MFTVPQKLHVGPSLRRDDVVTHHHSVCIVSEWLAQVGYSIVTTRVACSLLRVILALTHSPPQSPHSNSMCEQWAGARIDYVSDDQGTLHSGPCCAESLWSPPLMSLSKCATFIISIIYRSNRHIYVQHSDNPRKKCWDKQWKARVKPLKSLASPIPPIQCCTSSRILNPTLIGGAGFVPGIYCEDCPSAVQTFRPIYV